MEKNLARLVRDFKGKLISNGDVVLGPIKAKEIARKIQEAIIPEVKKLKEDYIVSRGEFKGEYYISVCPKNKVINYQQ